NAMRQAHADGWFIVFDTLTLADDRLEAFYDNPNALRDYFRDIGRMVLAEPDIEAERKKRDEIEAGKSYCSRRFGGATCDDKSAQIYARFDKNDWRIQPAEFYRFHDAEVNTFG